MISSRFWETKSLAEMSLREWEALCDGCGKCCLHKLEDSDTGEVYYTAVACRLLDMKTIRCRDYENRKRLVADCLRLDVDNIAAFKWLPGTCAYKVLAEGGQLADWHPLISGDPMSIHKAGVSVRGKIISEREAGDLQDHILSEDEI